MVGKRENAVAKTKEVGLLRPNTLAVYLQLKNSSINPKTLKRFKGI
jgi:hypothetical protein